MKLIPELTCLPNVDLTEEEKHKFLDYCEFLNVKCTCDEVPETADVPFCTLCKNVIKGCPEPQIVIEFLIGCY